MSAQAWDRLGSSRITSTPPHHLTSRTWCLPTLDRGAPDSIYTVGHELGHGGDSLVKWVYSHLGEIPHRSEVVEHRVDLPRESIPPSGSGLSSGLARARAQSCLGEQEGCKGAE